MCAALHRSYLFALAIGAVVLLLLVNIGKHPSAAAQSQDHPGSIRSVRSMETDRLDIPNPAGLTFSPHANTFYVVSMDDLAQSASSETELVQLAPTEDRGGSVRIPTRIEAPINMTFDGSGNRLLVFNPSADQLIEIGADADGVLLPDRLITHDMPGLDLQNPQGMTVDAAGGYLYIIDAAGPTLLRIDARPGGRFDQAALSRTELPLPDDLNPRGIAYDPTTGHLHLLSVAEQNIYEMTVDGTVVAIRDVAEIGLLDPQGMVFVASGDLTDDPEEMSLYIADSGIHGEPAIDDGPGDAPPATSLGADIYLPLVTGDPAASATAIEEHAAADGAGLEAGRVVELSFADVELSVAEVAAAASSTFQSSLVQTINASQWSPPSPDSAGITYLPAANRLLVTDSEVNEMSIFTGQNLFETDRYGTLVNADDPSASTICFSSEPTGVTIDPGPSGGHLFFSNDDANRIVEVDLGADGIICTSDDTVTNFTTSDFSSDDPEGVAFADGSLFIVDGVNSEVYRVAPGNNGIFDGVTPSGDDQVTSFDTQALGLTDPEGIAHSPDNGHLYIVGRPVDIILEVTTGGALVQTLDISAAPGVKRAGLAYAPSSTDPSEKGIYITDRGVDNGIDPFENDGAIYELTLPLEAAASPVARDDSASAPPGTSVTIDVAANDSDANADLAPATANTVCAHGSSGCSMPMNGSLDNHGDGTFTYTPDPGFSAVDTFVYEICDSGMLCDTASVAIDVGLLAFEVRVAASEDDAEERADGSVTFTSSDLEMVLESSTQVVGMRFRGVDIPQGAAISHAYIQFQVDETSSQDAAALTIQGESSDNAPAFAKVNGNITSRPKTDADVSWSPAPWTTVGRSGPEQRTPDIAAVIQEIVGRPGWSSGNSLAVIVHGSGKRTAESYNGSPSAAPLLLVEYTLGGNQSPTVGISAPSNLDSFNKGDDITFVGIAADPEDGDITDSMIWASDIDGGIGTGGSFSKSDLTVGTHAITASVTDSDGRGGSAEITLTINDNNQAPTVAISTPANNSNHNVGESITFTGSAADPEDGNISANLSWDSNINGNIGTGGSVTSASLSAGAHAISAGVTDSGGRSGSAGITLTINDGNQAPTVSISTPANNSNHNVGESITFTGSAADPEDGNISANLSWRSNIDGNIGTGGSVTSAGLSAGAHTIIAEATDSGGLVGEAQVVVTVVAASNLSVLEVRVASSVDDAEEKADGSVSLSSSDLEFVYDGGGNQTVGMRFNGISIPQNAQVVNAYVQFKVDETHTGATSLTIHGEDVDNAALFASAGGSISSRPKTAMSAAWTPPAWTTVGQAGADQRTPNIASVIQEIVSRSGWSSGNALVLLVTGNGERAAESYNGDPGGAALLHIEYYDTPVGNQAPTVSISAPAGGASFNQGDAISFAATAADLEDGDMTANLSWSSSLDGPIGAGGNFSRADLSLGTHVVRAEVTDSEGRNAFAQVTIMVSVDAPVLVGAGDIASCSNDRDYGTSLLLDNVAGTVFTLGDNAYREGTDAQFSDCYDPTWGRHKARTRPAAGNHDYLTPGAAGYFNYFGASAGEPDKGYYSYDVGDWHIIVLNSDCSEIGGCETNSVQGQWLLADLAANPTACTLAYWHHPQFSSGANHGGSTRYRDFWQILYDAGADVVLNGHEHLYERFAPQDPDGNADPTQGIREFIVGTGGASLYPFGPALPTSEIRENNTHGVLKLTLHPTSYDWAFIPVAGQTFNDTGSGACVGDWQPNLAPAVSINAPADGATVNRHDSIAFAGSAIDPEDGDISDSLIWESSLDGQIGAGSGFSLSDLSAGTHIITAGVTDSRGLLGDAQMALTVVGNGAPSVSITAPTDGATFSKGDSITFSGGADDPEDGDLTAGLAWRSSIDGNIGTGSGFSLSLLTAGTHTITASAADSHGILGDAQVTLTVVGNGAPSVSITAPTDGSIFREGDSVTFTGSADDPEDGDLTSSLAWHSSINDNIRTGSEFSISDLSLGTHTISASVTDNDGLVGQAQVTLTIIANTAPVVNITAPADNATFGEGAVISFAGTATDAENGDLSAGLVWTLDNSEIGTGASFTRSGLAVGTHTISASVTDSRGLDGQAQVTLTIVANTAPVVSIATPADNATFTEGAVISFAGTATDAENGDISAGLVWTLDNSEIGTGASFDSASLSSGTHTIIASVADSGGLVGEAQVVVTVLAGNDLSVLEVRVATSVDDAEERASGSVSLTSSDLEFVYDGGGNQTVGMRFNGISIPQNAQIVNAYVQFKVDETHSGATSLAIFGEDVDNAAPFSSSAGSISSRPKTTATVSWTPTPWTTIGQAGTDQRTPDITSVVQEIVKRSGWSRGNALALLVTGTGERAAESYNGDPGGAALLHIEYYDTPVGNQAPTVSISAPTAGAAFNQGDPITFSGNATDPEDGNITASLNWHSSIDGDIGTGSSFSRADLSLGTHTIRATAADSGALQGMAQIILTVGSGELLILEARVAASGDDAEERVGGSVSLSSSDLEFVYDGGGDQTVGIRFDGISLPQGAQIVDAYIQFKVDETHSGTTSLAIYGEDADNAAAFNSSNRNISSRTGTTAWSSWTPPPWTNVGQTGVDQRTPSIAPVIQEIVNRSGWSSGNALALIITGTGERTAESYNGDPGGAPLLHIEYMNGLSN